MHLTAGSKLGGRPSAATIDMSANLDSFDLGCQVSVTGRL